DADLHYLIGSDLKEGVVPLVTLAVTAFLVFLFARIFHRPPSYRQDGPLPTGTV
nr:hypothetical protein [Akkermansiaceae bacterium]